MCLYVGFHLACIVFLVCVCENVCQCIAKVEGEDILLLILMLLTYKCPTQQLHAQ